MDDIDWKAKLTPEQYKTLRKKGTEAPGSGKFLNHNGHGMYTCAACGNELFRSDDKYDSTEPGLIGWPSFSSLATNDAVKLQKDDSLFGVRRTEVLCAKCGGHLGHVFEASDSPTGQHYCINSVSLDFKETIK
jgi:peptide-methionine (R)-S-oxide reductase